ncbi:MAG: hypothetical protein ACKO4Q_06100, partial [Planctomycetota bacterium]
MMRSMLVLAGLVFGASVASAQQPQPGDKGGPGLALLTAKALVASLEGEQVVDHAVILVRDGKI